ncbi:peptide deformylase, partial [bacterium]|nr:peptide deformylase [bacterium]
EGCLSLPGIVLEIERAGEIVVEGLNAEGKRVELRASDLFARVLQHEIDHLNGLLIIDRISLAKRQLISGELKKLEKETKGRLSPEI